MNRLTDAKRYAEGSNTISNLWTERNIGYNRNGCITGLDRYGAEGLSEALMFGHTGNRLSSLSAWDGAGLLGNGYFTYDAMGNMLTDSRKGLQFSYNLANLPCRIERGDGETLTYTYLADGTKWSADPSTGSGLKYHGSFVFEDDGNAIRPSSVAWDEGRISFDSDGDYCDEWHVRDHLGSVRAVVGIGNYITGIRELNTYLPFGTRIPGSIQAAENRHRFSGKEEQGFGLDSTTGIPSFSTGHLDFGARYYDPYTCRWTTIDPMAGKYLSLSPYNYCAGNPVNIVDLDGKRFHKKTVGNTIIIRATYSANIKSSPSAKSAISFWNNRKNDTVTIEGKTYKINYKLSLKDDRFNRGTRIADNSYSVVLDSQLPEYDAGTTDRTGRNIKVKESWSETNDKGEKSTTGAHEVGHTLGMGHDVTGIMTPSQDESRTEEVTQQNLQQMIESGRGIPESPTVVDRIKQFFYDIISQN